MHVRLSACGVFRAPAAACPWQLARSAGVGPPSAFRRLGAHASLFYNEERRPRVTKISASATKRLAALPPCELLTKSTAFNH